MTIRMLTRLAWRQMENLGSKGLSTVDGLRIYDGSRTLYNRSRSSRRFLRRCTKSVLSWLVCGCTDWQDQGPKEMC